MLMELKNRLHPQLFEYFKQLYLTQVIIAIFTQERILEYFQG